MRNPNTILPTLVLDDQDSIIGKNNSKNPSKKNNNQSNKVIPSPPVDTKPLDEVEALPVLEKEKPHIDTNLSPTHIDSKLAKHLDLDFSSSSIVKEPISPISKIMNITDTFSSPTNSSQLLEQMEDEEVEEPPFTIIRLELLTIINSVVQTKPELLNQFNVQLWSVLSDWLVLYPHNNMYHSLFTTIYIAALKYNSSAISILIDDCKFWNKILPYYHKYGPFVSLYPYLSIMLYETKLVYDSLNSNPDSWVVKLINRHPLLKGAITDEEAMNSLSSMHITSWLSTQQYLSQRYIPASMYRFAV